MKAMVVRAWGGPEVFEAADMPKPVPAKGQVLVRVRASSVNPVDYKIRRGGDWASLPKPSILGYDAAGVVEAAGENVTHLQPGDEVRRRREEAVNSELRASRGAAAGCHHRLRRDRHVLPDQAR
jgi:NADPH:quinone reductase-like Zn-dependent oxidoreductase